jgi:hypothetical protein
MAVEDIANPAPSAVASAQPMPEKCASAAIAFIVGCRLRVDKIAVAQTIYVPKMSPVASHSVHRAH